MTTTYQPYDETDSELCSDIAETALLGAVAFHPDAMAGVLAGLAPERFYSPSRAEVWRACRDLSAQQQPCDPVSVARQLADTGQWRESTRRVVQREMAEPSSPTYAPAHAATITELARRRELLQAITRARQIVGEHTGEASELLARVRAQFDALDIDENDTTRAQTLNWSRLIDEFEAAHAPGAARKGIPTPWYHLDELIGGLHGGRMYTIGGRPGAGKSAAALNVASHAAVHSRKRVLIFSKEMPTVDVTGRILAWGAKVDIRSINRRELSGAQLDYIRDWNRRINNPDIRVNASPVSLEGIKTLTRAQHHRTGLDILVVDYLQLVKSDQPGRTREQEVARVSSELKALAMELDIVVVLPAQLNRESNKRADGRPTMADLRDSGQIEQDSDVVILLWHRPDLEGRPTGEITMIVDKNRHGPRGEITLRWHGGYGGME